MTPGQLSAKVVAERSEWIRKMLEGLRALPLETLSSFRAGPRTVPAAESFLRRALEALVDLGRHALAKGFGDAPAEYREVARAPPPRFADGYPDVLADSIHRVVATSRWEPG